MLTILILVSQLFPLSRYIFYFMHLKYYPKEGLYDTQKAKDLRLISILTTGEPPQAENRILTLGVSGYFTSHPPRRFLVTAWGR